MRERKDHTLFVVFHGLIPLVEHKDGFHAILIEMSDHWVSVGHWLAEAPFPKCQGAPLRLTGVERGCAGLDTSLNLAVNVPAMDIDRISASPDCYARIDLPKPRRIHSYFNGDCAGRLTGKDVPKSTGYSAVQVFEYAVGDGDFADVALTCAGETSPLWANRHCTTMDDGHKVSVVHIYNEPNGPTPAEHGRDEFLKGSALFGVDVGLANDTALPFPNDRVPTQWDMPGGLLVQELASPVFRQRHVNGMLSVLRTGVEAPLGLPVAGDVYYSWAHIRVGHAL